MNSVTKAQIERKLRIEKENNEKNQNRNKKETYFTAKQKAYYKKMHQNDKKNHPRKSLEAGRTQKMKWREGQILGHGSFGTVLWGFDERKNIQMAVKKVYLGGSADVSDVIHNLKNSKTNFK